MYLFRPNTYTHLGNQYFFSCYSPHIFYATSHHPTIPPQFVFSFSPCLQLFHLACFLLSISRPVLSHMPCIYSTIPSHSIYSFLLVLPHFSPYCGYFFFSTPSLFFFAAFFFYPKDWSGSKNRQTVTKRGESDEDGAENIERRNRGAERESDFRGNIMSEGPC